MICEVTGFKAIVAASGERFVLCPYMVEVEGQINAHKCDKTRGNLAL